MFKRKEKKFNSIISPWNLLQTTREIKTMYMNNKRKTKYKGKRKCDHRHLREAGSECYVALKKKKKKSI